MVIIMKKIAIVTRDCAGINTAIRAVVRTSCGYNIEVLGSIKGYDGMIDNKFIKLNRGSVSGIVNAGGTILKTSRSKRFFEEPYQKQAVKNIRDNEIDGIIVIGGNGSLRAAHLLATTYHIPLVAIPATIDNDISGVDLSIGTDTAVNVAVEAIDKIRDTATSLERIFVVEVMGRESGYIALQVALAGGCEEVLLPEKNASLESMCQEIEEGSQKGKLSWIIITAEGKAKAQDIADKINSATGLETRVAVLGHIQRGGRPTAADRILASRLGHYAVEKLRTGHTDLCVSIKENDLITIPLETAIQPKKMEIAEQYRLIKVLSK